MYKKILNLNTIYQTIGMFITSILTFTLIFYLEYILNINDFAKYSIFLLILPVVQALLTFNSTSLISIRILKIGSSDNIASFFIMSAVVNFIIILTIISLLITFKLITDNIDIYILTILISLSSALNDVHHQILLSKMKATFSYYLYSLEKISLILIIGLISIFKALDVISIMSIYVIITYLLTCLRFIRFPTIKLKLDFKINQDAKKFMFFSSLLFLAGYVSSNIDRVVSTVFLNDYAIAIYTKIFLLISGANMVVQSIIQSNIKDFYTEFNNRAGLRGKLRNLEQYFYLLSFLISIIILIIYCLFIYIIDKNVGSSFLIIYFISMISALLMIGNKPYGLYLDFIEQPLIKLYSSILSIFITAILFALFSDAYKNIYMPSLFLLASTLIYTIYLKKYIVNSISS